MESIAKAVCYLLVVTSVVFALSSPAQAQKFTEPEPGTDPDRVRGQIMAVENGAMVVDTGNGELVRLGFTDRLSVFSLSKASFTDVNFGTYVGSVSRKLDTYSPIVRDSLSWLHDGYELRIMDENLRGIAVGHRTWDLTSDSVMSHGWVDDLEIRILSIKYGPTEEEETDVDIPSDVPIHRMSLADRSLIKPGAHIFAGVQKDANDNYLAVYVMVGKDGVVPSL